MLYFGSGGLGDINEYVDERLIVPELEASTKEEAVHILADKIFEVRPDICPEGFTRSDLYRAVIERENIQTTGLGDGIAFPHARVERFDNFALAIGISKGA